MRAEDCDLRCRDCGYRKCRCVSPPTDAEVIADLREQLKAARKDTLEEVLRICDMKTIDTDLPTTMAGLPLLRPVNRRDIMSAVRALIDTGKEKS